MGVPLPELGAKAAHLMTSNPGATYYGSPVRKGHKDPSPCGELLIPDGGIFASWKLMP